MSESGRSPSPAAPPPAPVEECVSAILTGAVWRGFDGSDGVSKDEALEYASILATRVKAVLAYIAATGCTCPGDYQYGSLPDHDHGCVAQIEYLLTTDQGDDTASDLAGLRDHRLTGDSSECFCGFRLPCDDRDRYLAGLRRTASLYGVTP